MEEINTTAKITDEELQNVTGGDDPKVNMPHCSKYKTSDACNQEIGCRWNAKKDFCGYMLLDPKE